MVDYALRRRFRFVTLRPEFDSPSFSAHLKEHGASDALVGKIVGRMQALNTAIESDTKNLGAGFRIGHSFFCPPNGSPVNEAWYERVVRHEIVPLLEEYWSDDESKVREQEARLLG
jgi:5-methylcytosine-specific restriction protein B